MVPAFLRCVGLLALAAAAGCYDVSVRAVVYYSLTQVPESTASEHYEQFVETGGGVVELACLVVQRRQANCVDYAGNGEPNLRLTVVQCECPCTAQVADPCDATRGMVRAGEIRGLVNQSEGPVVLGGVEIPTELELSEATGMFITRERVDDPDVAPSTNVVLGGALVPDGPVLRGTLVSPSRDLAQGVVTVVPVRDEVSL